MIVDHGRGAVGMVVEVGQPVTDVVTNVKVCKFVEE